MTHLGDPKRALGLRRTSNNDFVAFYVLKCDNGINKIGLNFTTQFAVGSILDEARMRNSTPKKSRGSAWNGIPGYSATL